MNDYEYTVSVSLRGTSYILGVEYVPEEPDAGIREGYDVFSVNGVELDLPACPYSPAAEVESAEVLRAAGVADAIPGDLSTLAQLAGSAIRAERRRARA